VIPLETAESTPTASQPISRRQSSFTAAVTPLDTEPPTSQSSSTSSRQSLPNLKGKDLFDSMIWSDALTTSIFYTFISSLRQKILNDVKDTTETHRFIKALRDGGRLVRNYTQNIDMLEERVGLCADLERGPGNRTRFNPKVQKEPRPQSTSDGGAGGIHDGGVEVVALHGTLDRLRCGLCARVTSWDEEDRHEATLAGNAPECPWCSANNAKREGKGRRSLAIGRLRPDIVLYGEEHPSAHLVGPLITHDISLNPDVMLILGTSLRVHGLKIMVKEFAKVVHSRGGKVVFVNQTKPPESVWGDVIDYWVEWDCDAWVGDLKERREELWLPQGAMTEAREEKPKAIAKNPQDQRTDTTSGAYHVHKIMRILGLMSGRIQPLLKEAKPSRQSLTTKEVQNTKELAAPTAKQTQCAQPMERIGDDLQKLCDAQLMSTLPTPPNSNPSSSSSSSSSDDEKCRLKASASTGRPCRENGTVIVFEIISSLQGLTYPPIPRSSIGLPASGQGNPTSLARYSLGTISTNLPARRVRKPSSKVLESGARWLGMVGDENRRQPQISEDSILQSIEGDQQMQLPSPPTSDEALPEPPMSPLTPLTPRSQRIKRKSSITAILSSPTRPRSSIVWKD
jgi:NAD-dependent SIR2 family protein deacetylase